MLKKREKIFKTLIIIFKKSKTFQCYQKLNVPSENGLHEIGTDFTRITFGSQADYMRITYGSHRCDPYVIRM